MTVQRRELLIKISIPAVLIIGFLIFFATREDQSNFEEKYAGYDLNYTDTGRSNTYSKYLLAHENAAHPKTNIEIDLLSYENGENVKTESNFEGSQNVLITEEESTLEYVIDVKESGFYNVYIEYFALPGRGIDVERYFYINGEVPFMGADDITLNRVWSDAPGGVKQDNRGNDIRPTQIESPQWQKTLFNDKTGFIAEPYRFYFEKGKNTISLVGLSEPMAIRKLSILAVENIPTYSEYYDSIQLDLYANSDKEYVEKIQGESAQYRSSPSLYAVYDRSSGTTEPNSVVNTRLNMTGGQSWRIASQWIEWEFEVPEDGLYKISVKARQNYIRGRVSNRRVYIDDQVPFEEVSVIPFRYSNNWDLVTFADNNGDDVYFALTKGAHTLKFEVVLGELSDILTEMEESIYRLNQIYLQILVLTGTEPDRYRDYRIEDIYPNIIDEMNFESKIVYSLFDRLVAYSGEIGSEAAALQTLAKQLEKFVLNPQDIPKTLTNFKDNISGVGNSLIGLSEAQLDIDYILVSAKDAEIDKVSEGFFTKAAHEIKSFIASFFVDYDTLGDLHTDSEAIDVWMLSGRDQSSILKTMIDDTYTPNTGNLVNVRLVAMDTLMPAVVAGTGPDVALTVGNADPVNYAFRHAAMDLSQFDTFDEVVSEFLPSSLVPFEYNGGYYGLPETLNFNVMFYRKDVFEDLGIKIPNTWEELIEVIPAIQKNNMNIGIPSVERKINNIINPDLSNFFCHLYQNGGTLYNQQGSVVLLDSEVSVRAFENYTRLFTHYKAPTVYDFVNRFRTGEMPLGFVDYNTFNTLVVSAPEIKGLWDFTVLPGTPKEDGTIDRSVSCWGQAAMMLSNSKNPDAAWEFMSWWVGTDTQVRFGREMEALMGSSARYATANVNAFDQLAWSNRNSKILKEQWQWVVGTPEVPGGYYAQRHIVNAVRKVINDKDDTRETLLDYTRMINEELAKKREEFGLDL